MHTHQIEPKAIHVIFFCPIQYAFQNKFSNHRQFACYLITTCGGIRKAAVFFMPEIIAGYQLVKIRTACISHMIVHHIHYNPEPVFVKGCNHLFQFIYSCCTIKRIGTVTALRHIVVEWIVAPVVLRFFGLTFINRVVIKKGEEVNMGNTQFFYMRQSGSQSFLAFGAFFREPQVFAFMFNTSAFINTCIPYVQFVNHCIGSLICCRKRWTFIFPPPGRVG